MLQTSESETCGMTSWFNILWCTFFSLNEHYISNVSDRESPFLRADLFSHSRTEHNVVMVGLHLFIFIACQFKTKIVIHDERWMMTQKVKV